MKKHITFAVIFISAYLLVSGCAKKEGIPAPEEESAGSKGKAIALLEHVEVLPDDPLYYIPATDAKASSFDQTPDWAPEPNAMATVDGDLLTRWSSNYEEGGQWIYFDLGAESIVNNVIIRWERAYATEYQILVSTDMRTWQEVYREENGRGGTQEAVFPAVRCRYVKILGTEKIEDKWGISIWEVEIFGPRTLNPHSTAPKKEYLAKGEVDAKRKEADELIEELSSPIVPLSKNPFQQGVVYTSWTAEEMLLPASDFTLVRLKEMGFDTVSVMVPAYQDTLDSEIIFTNDAPGGDTPTEEALEHAIETCHKLGLRVMLKLHVDPRTDEARVDIRPSEKWFDSYEEMVLRYAALAQKNNVEIFSVGTELEATTFDAWTHRWKGIIARVRDIFKGVITYSANWTEYNEVPFADEMDYMGIDAYFPLTEKDDPSVEELVAAWEKRADEIEEWVKENGFEDKGVVFTEAGYTSADGTNRQPWAAISNREDQQEQADCLEAMFEVFSKRPWFNGNYLWQYMPQERWSPLGFTIDNKKAEKVVREWIERLKKT